MLALYYSESRMGSEVASVGEEKIFIELLGKRIADGTILNGDLLIQAGCSRKRDMTNSA